VGVGGETTCFAGFRKRLYWQKNEFGGREIEIAEGVVVSTPSATHLTGLSYLTLTLPHSPRSFERKPASLGEGRSQNSTICVNKPKKNAYIHEKNRQQGYKIDNKPLTNVFGRSQTAGRANER
jgi:hypothetical protein